MAKLTWDDTGSRLYETGTRMGVLYPINTTTNTYTPGVAWNGLTAITESPSGAESNPIYADDIKYLDLRSVEEFGATLEAYTYPEKWAECDGSINIVDGVSVGQQKRKQFGLSYRTILGNDTELDNYGYKIHLIYGATASPSERAYQTVNDSPEAITFSWEITTTPIAFKHLVDGVEQVILHNGSELKPTACITINSKTVDPAKLTALENILYGSENTDPRLPMPGEIYDMFKTN